MFTRKNKDGNIIRNKKTRKYKDSQQKGGGLTAEEEKTYYETLVSIIYDSDIETNFGGVADALLDSLNETTEYNENDQNTIITFLKESLDLINQYDKIIFYDKELGIISLKKTDSDKDRIKYLKEKYGKTIDNLKEQVDRVSQIIFEYSGQLTNDKTLLYI